MANAANLSEAQVRVLSLFALGSGDLRASLLSADDVRVANSLVRLQLLSKWRSSRRTNAYVGNWYTITNEGRAALTANEVA